MVDSATQSQLDTGRISRLDIIIMDFASGLHGFNSSVGPWIWEDSPFAGADIRTEGAGSIISISPVNQSSEVSENSWVVTMRMTEDNRIDPDVLSAIEDETYHLRPIYFFQAFFNPDTRELLSVEPLFRGRIDQVGHTENLDSYQLDFRCNDRFRDIRQSNNRVRTDADQRLIDVNDRGLEHVSEVPNQEIEFGKRPGLFGGFFKGTPKLTTGAGTSLNR